MGCAKRAGFKPAPTNGALELARRYMAVFYSGEDPEELRAIVAEDLVFEGPFVRCESADDYIEALRGDSREGLSYEVLWEFESGASACLVYRFSKPGVDTTMAQVFETRGGRIARITLVFDTGAFA